MLRITRDDSKLSRWFFQIDRRLLSLVLILMFIGAIASLSAGAANAYKLGLPWFHFVLRAIGFYAMGGILLFSFSMLNKKWIIILSFILLMVGMLALLDTAVFPEKINNSSRWLVIAGHRLFMPSEILKPALIMLTAWFLEKMHGVYGDNIFTKETIFTKSVFDKLTWWPYLLLFAACVGMILPQPDLGMTLLYIGVLGAMVLVARIPWKYIIFLIGGAIVGSFAISMLTHQHVKARLEQAFELVPGSQVWFSVNAIRHGGLFGSGEKVFVQDKLAESVNDFVYASIAEYAGALGACALVVILFLVVNNLIKHATSAKDEFTMYVLAGTAALFGGQVCLNLTTALHLFINKGMTLPFVSYGGWSILTMCVLFGMVLALIREDTWDR